MLNDLHSVAILLTSDIEFPWVIPIIQTLLWKPLIHTVILTGVDFPLIDPGSYTVLDNVKNLYLSGCKNGQIFFSLMPKLEVFGYNGLSKGDNLIDNLLPWGTLRELTVESDGIQPHSQDFVRNFETWILNVSSTRSSPLVELVFRDFHSFDVGMMARTFRGQFLRKLSIGRTAAMSVHLLSSVVDAFPELEEFSVFANIWGGSKTDFAKILGRLANLMSLDWDYFGEHGWDETDNETEQIPGPVSGKPLEVREKKRCTTVVKCLRAHCPQLRHVTFSWSREIEAGILPFEISRAGAQDEQDGSFQATVRYLGWESEWKHLTSFWKLGRRT